ncbi:MAG: hypothetical protein MJ070_00010 [Lachnospiraceae bacterium]|nr:hypothetical protein [Lachnospiraceae bacterium]
MTGSDENRWSFERNTCESFYLHPATKRQSRSLFPRIIPTGYAITPRFLTEKSHVFAAPKGKNQRKIIAFGFCFSGASWWHFVFESSEMGEIAEKSAFLRGKTSITHRPLKGFSALNVPLGGVGIIRRGF